VDGIYSTQGRGEMVQNIGANANFFRNVSYSYLALWDTLEVASSE